MRDIQRYENFLIEYSKTALPQWFSDHMERMRRSDSIIMWIVGLSAGAIVLVVSQPDAWSSLGTRTLNWSMGLFVLALTLGTLHRIVFYAFEHMQAQAGLWLQGYLAARSIPDPGPFELHDDMSREEVLEYLSRFFGVNAESVAEFTTEGLRDLYTRFLAIRKEFEERAVRDLLRALASAFGRPPEEVEKMLAKGEAGPEERKALRYVGNAVGGLFILTCLSFLAATLVLAAAFLF